MSILGGVSYYGQTKTQSRGLASLNKTMDDLTRQLASQKKHTNYSGLGFAALSVQQYRMDISRLDVYTKNIDHTTTSVEMMTHSGESIDEIGRNLFAALQSQFRADPVDMQTIRQTAQMGLEFVEDIINLDHNGKYLFSGSASNSKPLSNLTNGITHIQQQLTAWKDGTLSSAQFISNMNALTPTQLGFNPDLTSAGPVTARIDEYTDINYTSIGSENGFQDVLLALVIAANFDMPDPATDAATEQDFHDVLDGIMDIARRGIEKVEDTVGGLGGKYEFLGVVRESHQTETGMLQGFLSQQEDIDPSEVSLQILALQTQIQASYQVTSLVSQLSLVNFI